MLVKYHSSDEHRKADSSFCLNYLSSEDWQLVLQVGSLKEGNLAAWMKLKEREANLLSHVRSFKAGVDGQVLIFPNVFTAIWWKWVVICLCNRRLNKHAFIHVHSFLPWWLVLVCSFLQRYLGLGRLCRPYCFGELCEYIWRRAAVCGDTWGKPFACKENEGWSPLIMFAKSTALSSLCKLSVARNSSTVESLCSSILFYEKETEAIRNSILTHYPNLGLSNIVDLSPENVSVFTTAFCLLFASITPENDSYSQNCEG